MQPVMSPNGGRVQERQALQERFSSRLTLNPHLSRKHVSYQGNRAIPGFRWMKYKEGFSRTLVEQFVDEYEATAVLDPFAGIGTTVLVAAGRGKTATGIEIMPVGVLAANGIAEAANGVSKAALEAAGTSLLRRVVAKESAPPEFAFPHVGITEAAFPEPTELALAKARQFIASTDHGGIRTLLNLACMAVLEQVSYTRKDGQYLRWDYRSGRTLRSRVHKGPVLTLEDAIGSRLFEMVQDIDILKQEYGYGYPEFMTGSCLELMHSLPDSQFDMTITSPPYANRYDYTRTYALELAWLGYEQEEFSRLRQRMLSATVENKTKVEWLRRVYKDGPCLLDQAFVTYESQGALHEVLGILKEHLDKLANRHVIRLLEGYFLEMAVIIAELGRVTRPGGIVIMVNDNVQYHGEEVPVDLILSDFAEQLGFTCETVWILPISKGNSSQQMGRFGKRALRKCVYKWVKRDG